MQNLVGIGVADSTEEVRVGQGAFESVILFAQCACKCVEASVQDVEATRIVLFERVAPADDKKRSLPPCARLGQDECAVGEVEGEEANLARHPSAGLLPVKTTGNHQVQDEEELGVELEHDPFSEAVQRDNRPAVERRQRRVDGAEQKRRYEADSFEPTADDTRPERMQIKEDVGEFWQLGTKKKAASF